MLPKPCLTVPVADAKNSNAMEMLKKLKMSITPLKAAMVVVMVTVGVPAEPSGFVVGVEVSTPVMKMFVVSAIEMNMPRKCVSIIHP